MNRFQNPAKISEIEKIKTLIMSCGFEGISDSTSQNKIYSKNGTVITIRQSISISEDELPQK
ncbi:MAG: hypothetical protein JW840_07180 [Candidatus Thermoplasmatota archaeon]|nr:hypothetical protein [Candidatus Thermoplasmatota archaeon]